MTKEVYIVSCVRTPVGSFRGQLSPLSAPQLGSLAIKAALEKINLSGENVDEIYMGHVLQANCGQAPARRAALDGGVTIRAPCTTVNKVCASGMKSVIFGAQSIQLGDNDVIVAGGMESMSNAPYYLKRDALPYGGVNLPDALIADGLTDSRTSTHMGNFSEKLASDLSITRAMQDEYAISSYKKSAAAAKNGSLAKEIVPVKISSRKGDLIVTDDEEYTKVDFDKLLKVSPAFQKDGGTITAANASTLSDGAAACVLMSKAAVEKYGVKPLAVIVGYADASIEPEKFGIAPTEAVKKLLKKIGKSKEDISIWEINEAFSVVALANMKLLELNPALVNVNGGAVSLGHPLGMSGARIFNALVTHLEPGKLGIAAVCNGGGGASAICVQRL